MLVTPGNGIMFLASFSFLAIGLVGWISFKRPDFSAKLWMLGFMVSGGASMLGALGGADVGPWPFISSTLALAASFVLFGLALKVLYAPRLPLRDYLVVAGGVLLVYLLCLGYAISAGSESAQIVLFALGNGIAAAWATHQAIQLNARSQSPYVTHLIIMFGIQAAFIFLRIPQALVDDPLRLWEHSVLNELILAVLSICGIIKAVSYFALRFEEVRAQLELESGVIREQAQKLAQKNAEIASAMHIVPIACVVTNPSLDVIYSNTQARRLFGQPNADTPLGKLSDWMLGFSGVNQLSFAAAHHMMLVAGKPPSAIAVEVSASGLESDSSAAQWVFLIKPIELTESVTDSIWAGIPRAENRIWMIADRYGRIAKAQANWGDLLGSYAVFDAPELGFASVSDSREAKGMDLWASLKGFSRENEKIDRARRDLESGAACALLLRDETGTQLSFGFLPIRGGSSDESHWVIEISWKQLRVAPITPKASSAKALKNESIDKAEETQASVGELPDFLRQK